MRAFLKHILASVCMVSFLFLLTPMFQIELSDAIYAQDFDDDFEEDEEESESSETESSETESEENTETTESEEKDDDEFSDETEEDKTEREAEKKEDAAEKERLKKEAEEREKKRLEAEKKRREAEAQAERNLREAKKKAEQVKRKKYGSRIADRKKSLEYRSYYAKIMAKNNVGSRLVGRSGFSFSFGLGFQPNTANAVNEGFSFSDQLPFYLDNGLQFTSIQLSAPGFPQNKGVSHVANLFQKQVADINSVNTGSDDAQVEKSSGSISTFPIAVSAAYYGSFFIARAGVNFHHSFIGLGGTNKISFTLPFSTNNERVFVQHETTLLRLEVPVSFALRILSSQAFGAYLGGGPSFFWGVNTSELTSTENVQLTSSISGAFEPETDKFSAIALGFHFLLGIEAQLMPRTYLVVELFQNFGTSGRVKDSAIGERSTSASGSAESERPDEIKLNFTGTEILLSVRYFI